MNYYNYPDKKCFNIFGLPNSWGRIHYLFSYDLSIFANGGKCLIMDIFWKEFIIRWHWKTRYFYFDKWDDFKKSFRKEDELPF